MDGGGRKNVMGEKVTLREALPAMLSTQLLAADVYALFLSCAREKEEELWRTMLRHELNHIRFVSMLMMEEELLPELMFPSLRMDAYRDLCEKARSYACESAFERTLWALRLEHAQIDFGVEAIATKMVGRSPNTPVYPGPIEEHYDELLNWAERFRASREIAVQVARIEEHLPSRQKKKG